MEIIVKEGDITQEPADALITAINSGGMWYGGIDGAIQRVAGNQYHNLAARTLGIAGNQETIVACLTEPHRGKFRDVVFVIDDLNTSLYDVVTRGLSAAKEAGAKVVTMPMIRFGLLAAYGGSANEKLDDIVAAMLDWRFGAEREMERVTIVVYGDESRALELARRLDERTETFLRQQG